MNSNLKLIQSKTLGSGIAPIGGAGKNINGVVIGEL